MIWTSNCLVLMGSSLGVGRGILRQAFYEGIDPRACSGQFGFQEIAFVGQGQHLLLQQCIGFMQFFVPEQQVLDAICNLVDGGGIRHVR